MCHADLPAFALSNILYLGNTARGGVTVFGHGALTNGHEHSETEANTYEGVGTALRHLNSGYGAQATESYGLLGQEKR